MAEIEPKLQHNGNISKTWAKQNKLLEHYDKTICMTVGTGHNTRELPELNIVIDYTIKKVHDQNLLDKYTLDSKY